MRVLVCGGRDYNDRDHIWNTLCALDSERGPFAVVIHGCATGADSEGMIWAQALDRKHAPFRADWHAHGKAAGPLRNQRMLDEGKPDLVIAFPGGRGTADMMRRAQAAGVEVIQVAAKADRSAKRQDPQGLGPKGESGGRAAICPNDTGALLPCPFAHQVERGPSIEVDDEEWCIATVICGDCGTRGPYVDLDDFPHHGAAEAAASRLWNVRTPTTPERSDDE